MNPAELAAKLRETIAESTPEELAKMLYQLTVMKPDFERSETHKKTWRILFSKIALKLNLLTIGWGD